MATTRRTLLGGAGALGLVAGVPVARAGAEGAVALRRALVDLPIGERFAGDWVLLDAYAPVNGGVSLVIGRGIAGRPLRVDVTRRGDPVKAPVVTEDLELFTMDAGGGVGWIDDSVLVALSVLGERLQRTARSSGLLAGLLTHDVRVRRFPGFMKRAARELAPVGE